LASSSHLQTHLSRSEKKASPGWDDWVFPLILIAAFTYLSRFQSPAAVGPRIWVQKAHSLMSERKYQEALKFSDDLLVHFPNNHVYLEQAATIEHSLGHSSEEAKMLERFIKVAPDPSEACPRIIHAYQDAKEPVRMLDAAKRCTEIEPHNSDFQLELALALERTGDLGQALSTFAKGQLEFPDYTDFAIGQARVLLHAGRGDEAWQQIQEILAGHPDNADAELVGGLAAMRMNDWAAAKQILARGVREHPNYNELREALKVATDHGAP
jgi:tetratricopeptide (TPR) repeat protein